MKEKLQAALIILGVETVHFMILTAFLCGIGFFTRDNGGVAVTFTALLWTGAVSFWFDGFGAIFLLSLLLFIGWEIWEFFADRKAFEQRRKNFDQEVGQMAHRRAEELRPQMKSAIVAAVEKDFAEREQELAEKEAKFAAYRWELNRDRMELEAERSDFQEEKGKVLAWKFEVDTLRRKAEIAKERRASVKRHIRWAIDALAGEPLNVGLALRHLKKAEKE